MCYLKKSVDTSVLLTQDEVTLVIQDVPADSSGENDREGKGAKLIEPMAGKK